MLFSSLHPLKHPLALLLISGIFVAGPVAAQDFDYYTPRILDQWKRGAPYLPDFSYAGYHFGEEPIPHHPPTLSVVDFGAVPDDGKDDTDAILAAVEAAHEQPGTAVVRFPPGRFILREIIWIERSNFVLQGSGSGEGGTVIDLPRPLWDMDLGRVAHYRWVKDWMEKGRQKGKTIFAFQSGIIWTRIPGGFSRGTVAAVRKGKRGRHELIVDATEPISVGDVYELVRRDPDAPGSLLDHVMGGVEIESGTATQVAPITEYVTITGVRGNRVTVKEPLFHDVREEWPTTLERTPFLEEIGVERIRFECTGRKEYRGHHTERGYNPIAFTSVRNGWVRDVSVDNADSGILASRCYLVTLEDITVTGELGAHYGVKIGPGQRCLARNISADMKAIHVLSVNTRAHGCVYTDCMVRTGRLDQHVGLNWQNLFDDIVVKQAEHGWGVFGHGGNAHQFPLHGAFNTFWNLRLIYDTETIEDIPQPLFGSIIPGAAARLVCFRANVPLRIHYYNVDAYIEGTNRVIADEYASLYKWQLARRLGEDHPEVVRVKSGLSLEIATDTPEVQAGDMVPMRAYLYNWTYNPVTLRNPDGESAKLRWEIWPLDAETLRHANPHEIEASANIPKPGEEYKMLAGTGKVLTGWLRPVEFPSPGTYEVVLVYEGAEGDGVELRSHGLAFRVGE